MSDNADIVRAGIRIHPDEPADVMVDLKQRALAALDAMEARERDLVAERDEARQEAADMTAGQTAALARARAAEAEVERLRNKHAEGADLIMSGDTSVSGEVFRYCIYCGTDCHEDDPEHGPDCPYTTGLWPVTEKTLGIRGPDDPYAHGMRCMDCGEEFKVGDVYAHRPTEEGDVFEIVCIGCRVLSPDSGNGWLP